MSILVNRSFSAPGRIRWSSQTNLQEKVPQVFVSSRQNGRDIWYFNTQFITTQKHCHLNVMTHSVQFSEIKSKQNTTKATHSSGQTTSRYSGTCQCGPPLVPFKTCPTYTGGQLVERTRHNENWTLQQSVVPTYRPDCTGRWSCWEASW